MTRDEDFLRDLLTASNIPLQLRVERMLKGLARQLEIDFIVREAPDDERFLDIICTVHWKTFLIECKRVVGSGWLFLAHEQQPDQPSPCYLEYFNGHADAKWAALHGDRVFVDRWGLHHASVISDFNVASKQSAHMTVEFECRQLLARSRTLLGSENFGSAQFALGVPVIVTDAKLWVCRHDAVSAVSLDSGELPADAGQLQQIDVVRFTKAFAARRSNCYEANRLDLKEWVEDRKRTVFIMNPGALEAFIQSFQGVLSSNGTQVPAAFEKPPDGAEGRR